MKCCQIYIGIILNVITVAMVMIYKWTKWQRSGEMSQLHPQSFLTQTLSQCILSLLGPQGNEALQWGEGDIKWKPFKSYFQVDLHFFLLMLQQVKTGSRYISSFFF